MVLGRLPPEQTVTVQAMSHALSLPHLPISLLPFAFEGFATASQMQLLDLGLSSLYNCEQSKLPFFTDNPIFRETEKKADEDRDTKREGGKESKRARERFLALASKNNTFLPVSPYGAEFSGDALNNGLYSIHPEKRKSLHAS